MERVEKIDGEEFVVKQGTGECMLEVANGKYVGAVAWHKATQRYRGEFNGWGADADSVEGAVAIAARRIIATPQANEKPGAATKGFAFH